MDFEGLSAQALARAHHRSAEVKARLTIGGITLIRSLANEGVSRAEPPGARINKPLISIRSHCTKADMFSVEIDVR
jgi:hypothetical protein